MSLEKTITDDVVARFQTAASPRLGEILESLVRHLHDFVRDIQPTEAEWEAAIHFLTETGHKCDDKRQEFILLSDTLGVSMLVDALNHRSADGATESTVFGPFYTGLQPDLPFGGDIVKAGPPQRLTIEGHILDTRGKPIPQAQIEVWQANDQGFYDVQDPSQPPGNLRATLRSDDQGRYQFKTLPPTPYPIPTDGPVGKLLAALGRSPYRPAHIHFMISAPGYSRLITHLFPADTEYLENDPVFGVKDQLIVRTETLTGEPRIQFDFRLKDQD